MNPSASNSASGSVGRRRLLTGAGAGALAVTGGLLGAGAAQAAPVRGAQPPAGDGTAPAGNPAVLSAGIEPASSPVGTSIASAPTSGYTYRVVDMYEFRPFDPAGAPTWGGYGVYTAGTSTALRASVEIPAGALVREVEYYVYNNSGSTVFPETYLWVPGQGAISPVGGSASVPSVANSITAARVTVAQQGPYPLGSKLLVSITTPVNATVQINGARVGFTQGAAQIGLLPGPVRVYDSRSGGGKIRAGATRTITLPANLVPAGSSGVIINLTAVDGAGPGYLKIASAAVGQPGASAINFGVGAAIANAIVVGISAGRQLNITASIPVDVVVDLTGVIA